MQGRQKVRENGIIGTHTIIFDYWGKSVWERNFRWLLINLKLHTHGKERNLSINHHQYTYIHGTKRKSTSLIINYLNGSHKHRKSTKENIYRIHNLMNKENED